MGKLLGAPSLRGPRGLKRAHFACLGKDTQWNLQRYVKDQWVWMCAFASVELTWASVRPAFLWLPSDNLKEMKRFIGSGEESGQEGAWGELRFPSDVSTHGFFAGRVRCVLCILILSPISPLSLSLSLTGSHLCALSLELSAFYFFVLGNLESAFGISNGAIFLALCFWNSFWKM